MENMIAIFIVIAVALLVFLFFVLRSAYRSSHVPLARRFILHGLPSPVITDSK